MASPSSHQLKASECETKRQWIELIRSPFLCLHWPVTSADREEAPRSSSDLISRGDRGEVQDGGGDTRGHGFSPAYKHEPKGKGATSQNPVLFRRKYSDPVLCEDHSHK